MLARIARGLRASCGGTARLAGTLLVTVIFNIFGWPFNSLVPVVAQEHLRLGPEAVGLLAGMDGVGAFTGALLIAWLVPARRLRAVLPRRHRAVPRVGGAVRAGAASARGRRGAGAERPRRLGFSIMQATLVYLAAPPELRSRVLGILSVCIGLGPIGFVHIGLLAEAIGARGACVVSAAEGLLALALTRRWWRGL